MLDYKFAWKLFIMLHKLGYYWKIKQNQLEVIAEEDQLSDDIGIMMAITLKPMIVQIQTTQSLRIQMETLTVTVRSALMNY